MTERPGLEHIPLAEHVAARLAIADLIHRYARHIRRDEPDQVAALFTADSFYEMRNGSPDSPLYSVRKRLEGPAQIDAYIGAGKGKPHPVPVIHNVIIEVNGDTATADCVMEGRVFTTGQNVIGEYRDELRCLDGRWFFSSRTFTMYSEGSTI